MRASDVAQLEPEIRRADFKNGKLELFKINKRANYTGLGMKPVVIHYVPVSKYVMIKATPMFSKLLVNNKLSFDENFKVLNTNGLATYSI